MLYETVFVLSYKLYSFTESYPRFIHGSALNQPELKHLQPTGLVYIECLVTEVDCRVYRGPSRLTAV